MKKLVLLLFLGMIGSLEAMLPKFITHVENKRSRAATVFILHDRKPHGFPSLGMNVILCLNEALS